MAFPSLKRKPPEAAPAVSPEAAELIRLVRITITTPEILAEARLHFESLSEGKIQKLMALGMQLLRRNLEHPSVLNNLKHVEDQLLRPVMQDAEELANTFGVDPTRFRLLVILHDLGKAEIPEDLMRVLKTIFPEDYVAREILTHEYASMRHVELMGEEAGLSVDEVRSLQRLIANHNFGPNLCLRRHKALRNNWWPSNFREKIMPALERVGLDLSAVYHKSEDGEYQYHHAEDDVYAALLAAYDRAIANKFNSYGVLTWQKFAQQDYLDWEAALGQSPFTPSTFNATDLTVKMHQAALWAETEIRAMWVVLCERHLLPSVQNQFTLADFVPYRRQLEGVQRLLAAIERVRQSNATPVSGVMKYTTRTGESWRVDDRARGSIDDKAKLKIWDSAKEEWCLVAEDNSPIKLYFEIVRSDI